MRSALFFGFCVVVLSLSGCAAAFDPFQRPGNWTLTGASNETIAQQAANKGDLISGQSEPGSNGAAAVGGVEKGVAGGLATGLQTTVSPNVSNQSAGGS